MDIHVLTDVAPRSPRPARSAAGGAQRMATASTRFSTTAIASLCMAMLWTAPAIGQTAPAASADDAGLVLRTVHPVVPPHVDYQLSELGQALQPVMSSLQQWGKLYLSHGGRHGRCREGQLHNPEETGQP